MNAQTFFYVTSSSAIIIVAFLFVILIVFGIVIAARIAKTFRNVSRVSGELSETVKNFREKIKVATLTNLLNEGLKEMILFVKEKRENKRENEKRKK